jgi:DNA-binding protein HU-beta
MAKSTTQKMNRTELVDSISMNLGVSKAQGEKFLNTFVSVVTDSLAKGIEVNITGFGVFRKVTRSPRKGVNPKTRQPMQIAASTSVAYKVGKTLKEAVKSGK